MRLVGPLFPWELARLSRRRQHFLARTLPAFLFLACVGSMFFGASEWSRAHLQGSRAQAQFTQNGFQVVIVFQLLVSVILTPGYFATAIADERDRRTLDDMLTTPLARREILFGKCAARVIAALQPTIACLGLLGILQLFGGIDLVRVAAAGWLTAMVVIQIAAAATLASVLARNAVAAVLLAYLFAAIVLALPEIAALIVQLALAAAPAWAQSTNDGLLMKVCLAIFDWEHSSSIRRLVEALATGLPVDATRTLLAGYTVTAASEGVLCLFLGVRWLRSDPPSLVWRRRRTFSRAARADKTMGDRDPMSWKETVFPPRIMPRWLRIVAIVGLLAILAVLLSAGRFSLRGCLALVSSCLVLSIWGAAVIRAAYAIVGERGRGTWESLLTTPLPGIAIVRGKFVGALGQPLLIAAWLTPLLLAGLLTSGLSASGVLVAALVIAVAILVPGFAYVQMALWVSLTRPKVATCVWQSLFLVSFMGGFMQVAILAACSVGAAVSNQYVSPDVASFLYGAIPIAVIPLAFGIPPPVRNPSVFLLAGAVLSLITHAMIGWILQRHSARLIDRRERLA